MIIKILSIDKIFISSMIFLSLTGCSHSDSDLLKFSGTIEMTEHAIGFPTSGRVAEMFVEEEQNVQRGEIIAHLDHFEQAKRDFDRAADLVKSGGVSQQEYEHIRQDMEDRQLTAPIDGTILLKVREMGEVVNAGDPIVIVGDSQKLWIKIFVPENLIAQLAVNQKAKIYIDGIKYPVDGHVGFIATKAEFTPRNIQTPEERTSQTLAAKVFLDIVRPDIHPGVAADVHFESGHPQ